MTRTPDYMVSGDGDVTVYMLNGVYGAKEMWRYVAARLVGKGYRVVAWDAPGYGISPLPRKLSFEVIADAGARLVEKTSTRKNVLFGQSMGAQVIPQLYARTTGRVNAIVMSSTIGYFGNRTKEEQEEFVRQRTGEQLKTDPISANRQMIDKLRSGKHENDEVMYVRDIASKTRPETIKAAIDAISAYPADVAVAAIKAIHVPTLLVAGEDDHSAPPSTMKRIADMIDQSELCVVPDSGHYPWAENPTVFDRYLFDFLGRHLSK